MKKLFSIIFGLALVMGLMISSASAGTAKIEFDATGDGNVDATGNLDSTMCASQTLVIGIYATGLSDPPHATDKVFGIKGEIHVDLTKLTVLSGAVDTSPGWDPSFSNWTDNGGGDYVVDVAVMTCLTPVGGKLKIGTMTVKCNGVTAISSITSKILMPSDGGVGAATFATPDPNPAVGCTNAVPESGVAGSIAIDIGAPPCANTISPASATITSSGTGDVTGPTFSVSTAGVCSPTTISYSDNCASADVNAITGILTVHTTLVPEDCTVTATDSVNTGACALGDCTASVHINAAVLCSIEIYIGGAPVPPLNTYNKPGRRGIALTCGDTVQFSTCTDCDPVNIGQNTPCPVFSIDVTSGSAPAGTTITEDGLLTIGPCDLGINAPATIAVTVTDPCNSNTSDTVEVLVGQVVLTVEDTRAQPGAQGVNISVSLDNLDHAVKAIATDLRDDDDLLSCTGCTADAERALAYTCIAMEQTDGDCRVILYSTNPSALIAQGTGTVFTVEYDVAANAPSDGCITIVPTDSDVADRFGDPLCTCEVAGDVCFILCGDVYPRECLPNPNCGDGVVDIFDILEEVDFVLGIISPSACQMTRADVPTGTPPYCSDPDQVIDIFDVLVIIDMALGKANCCDYYFYGLIY